MYIIPVNKKEFLNDKNFFLIVRLLKLFGYTISENNEYIIIAKTSSKRFIFDEIILDILNLTNTLNINYKQLIIKINQLKEYFNEKNKKG